MCCAEVEHVYVLRATWAQQLLYCRLPFTNAYVPVFPARCWHRRFAARPTAQLCRSSVANQPSRATLESRQKIPVTFGMIVA